MGNEIAVTPEVLEGELLRPYIEYSSNNSGGGWWLDDDDWRALEAAGWEVQWAKDDPWHAEMVDGGGRWLGALAMRARRYDMRLPDAIAEWEQITGQRADDEGCPCCGHPHDFSAYAADGSWAGGY